MLITAKKRLGLSTTSPEKLKGTKNVKNGGDGSVSSKKKDLFCSAELHREIAESRRGKSYKKLCGSMRILSSSQCNTLSRYVVPAA